MGILVVDTFEIYALAVDEHDTVLDFNVTETELC